MMWVERDANDKVQGTILLRFANAEGVTREVYHMGKVRILY